jgi:hypothetical protein
MLAPTAMGPGLPPLKLTDLACLPKNPNLSHVFHTVYSRISFGVDEAWRIIFCELPWAFF